MRWLVVVAMMLLVTGAAAAPRAPKPCASLASLGLPHASVTSATEAKAGQVAACKVDVTSRPTADSEIGIEVWIPQGAAWNGRYLQLGNGGFAGQISSAELQAYASVGYAVAMTDDGHHATLGADASWAVGHPEKLVDFGWRALKETTETAKALISAYQDEAPRHAYFSGCSDGGREALMEAQRFPDDFDGVIAGAPAYNFTGLFTLAARDEQALAAPGAYLDLNALKALQAGVLAKCGDGLAYVPDPAACRFDPASVACSRGDARADCLKPAQVAAARAIYRGLEGPGLAYPGYTPGGEAGGGWQAWITGPSAEKQGEALLYLFAQGYWGGMVHGDLGYDILTLDVSRAPDAAAAVSKIVDATDPDLSRFRAHGGKLIIFHGWNDAAIPPAGSIAYYEDMRRRTGGADAFARLYLIPGMQHCGGGPGPGDVDLLQALVLWKEKGEAPGPLRATAAAARRPPTLPQSQLLCPYPATADGTRCISVEIEAPPPPPHA